MDSGRLSDIDSVRPDTLSYQVSENQPGTGSLQFINISPGFPKSQLFTGPDRMTDGNPCGHVDQTRDADL